MACVINIQISKENCFAERYEKNLLSIMLEEIISTAGFTKEVTVNVNVSD